jgi:putative peptidoglycan lipid II flippase
LNPAPPHSTEDEEIKPLPPDASLNNGGEDASSTILDENANAIQDESTGKSVALATAGIGFLHLIRLLVATIAKPLVGDRMGLLASADVYTVATDIVTSIWRFWEKVVNPTFLPCFIGALKNEGEERAWRFASTAMWLTCLSLLVATPLSLVLMPQIVDLYSQKASQSQIDLTIAVARLLMCGLFFLGVSSLTYVILNGYKRFFSAALGDALWKMGVLCGAGIAVARKLDPIASIYLIAWGFLIGSFLKLLPHLLALRNKWYLLRPRINLRDALIRKMLWLCIPLLVGIVVSEGRDVYIKWLADSPLILVNGKIVEGSRTALSFSRTIGDALLQIFPYALSIGIFPYLANLAHERDRQSLTDTLVAALRACIFMFGPLTALLIALRFPLLRAVWESGKFSQADTFVLSLPFVFYALGLIGFSCEMMLNQTFYALTNVWAPTLVGLGTTVLWIATATWGVHMGWGLASLAAAESLAKSTKCVILWYLLRRNLGKVRVSENLLFVGKIVLASLAAAGAAWLLSQKLVPTGEVMGKMDKIKMLLAVAVSGSAGLLVFGIVTRVLAVEETRALAGLTTKIRRKFGG